MTVVRVQNIRGEWLRFDHSWTQVRSEAITFHSLKEAEEELNRLRISWIGQVMFDVSDG